MALEKLQPGEERAEYAGQLSEAAQKLNRNADSVDASLAALDAAVAALPTQMANQASSTQETSPTVAEFNALLDKLKAAGLMTADE